MIPRCSKLNLRPSFSSRVVASYSHGYRSFPEVQRLSQLNGKSGKSAVSMGRMDDDDDDDGEDEEEEDGERFSQDEIDAMLFKGKDFTQLQLSEVKIQKPSEKELRTELDALLGSDSAASDVIIDLWMKGGRPGGGLAVPTDIDTLLQRVVKLLDYVETGQSLTERIKQFEEELFGSITPPNSTLLQAVNEDDTEREGEGESFEAQDRSSVTATCFAACLISPRLLSIPATATSKRKAQLQKLLSTSPYDTCRLCLKSPSLLLVPWAKLEDKLRAMKRATGLDLQACASMLTLHMF